MSAPLSLLLVAVVLAAVGGGATAAKLITGKQIKNNSVSTKDIKNRSLKLQDIEQLAVAKLDRYVRPTAGRLYIGGDAFYSDNPGIGYHLVYTDLPFQTPVPLSVGSNLYFGASVISTYPIHTDTTKCAGTGAAPAPQVGVMCVYLIQATNVQTLSPQLGDGAIENDDLADRTGFHIYAQSIVDSEFRFHYIWAYRVP